ncbi:hypothetical protein E4T56_gene19598 [Termitomyces sp. T112]|nr:hypothetical protein E4T56_gene19598 [Termitomyces sp. T112]
MERVLELPSEFAGEASELSSVGAKVWAGSGELDGNSGGGGQREGALAAVDKEETKGLSAVRGRAQQEAVGTQVNGRASGASLLLSYLRRAIGTGFKFPRAPAFNHRGFPMLAGGGFDDSIDGMRGGAPTGKGGSGCSTEGEGGAAAGAEHFSWEVQPMEVAEGWQVALEGGSLQVELEAAGQREDWLVREAASGCVGVLFRRGAGAPSSPRQCLYGTSIDPRQVDTDVRGSPSGASAGDGEDGEVAGGASAAQHGGPGVIVGSGGGCGGGLARVGRGSSSSAGPNVD